jgi:phosphopantetheine adenylyltransferase
MHLAEEALVKTVSELTQEVVQRVLSDSVLNTHDKEMILNSAKRTLIAFQDVPVTTPENT